MIFIYMESNPAVAKRQITKLGQLETEKLKKIWNELSDELNEIGPAVKNYMDWQAVRHLCLLVLVHIDSVLISCFSYSIGIACG